MAVSSLPFLVPLEPDGDSVTFSSGLHTHPDEQSIDDYDWCGDLPSPPPSPQLPEPAAPVTPWDPARSLVVFDWDDCLFPTWLLLQWHAQHQVGTEELTDLRRHPQVALSDAQREQLDALENLAIEVFGAAQALGTVLIITNSQTGWVERSCSAVWPKLWTHLRHTAVYSARSMHQTPDQVLAEVHGVPPDWLRGWKTRAFAASLRQLPHVTHVLAFGDSLHDRDAALSARHLQYQRVLNVSNVLTARLPDCSRYQQQWTLLAQQLKTTFRFLDVEVDLCVRPE